jgi:uncharacterized OsmC-like protein
VSSFSVETRTIAGQVTAVGHAGPFTVVIDRPKEAGGGGLGFNGGQLMYLSIAACISNDLFREAAKRHITLRGVRVTVEGDFAGDPAVSTEITYHVDVDADAGADVLGLVSYVDEIAEIPNSIRNGTRVRLTGVGQPGLARGR